MLTKSTNNKIKTKFNINSFVFFFNFEPYLIFPNIFFLLGT